MGLCDPSSVHRSTRAHVHLTGESCILSPFFLPRDGPGPLESGRGKLCLTPEVRRDMALCDPSGVHRSTRTHVRLSGTSRLFLDLYLRTCISNFWIRHVWLCEWMTESQVRGCVLMLVVFLFSPSAPRVSCLGEDVALFKVPFEARPTDSFRRAVFSQWSTGSGCWFAPSFIPKAAPVRALP